MRKIKELFEDAAECVTWFWQQLRRTDLGDEEHYPNGFRKFSCFGPVSYFNLAAAIIALILCLAK